MIELRGIRKVYQLGDEEVRALDGVDLTIRDREFVAIIGSSGSGKSTLMNIIGCLDTADEGSYFIDGQDVSDLSEHDQSIMRNRKIGFIFQQFNLLMKLTAYENVELPLIYQGVAASERRQRVIEALKKVGLESRMDHRPNQLSGGQQQRVAVARALVTKPSLILADEPTGNLDSRSTQDIMELLKELHAQGNTLIVITHDTDIAAQAPRRVQLFDGKVVSDTAGEMNAEAVAAAIAAAEQGSPVNAAEDKTHDGAPAAEETAAAASTEVRRAVSEMGDGNTDDTAAGDVKAKKAGEGE